MSRFRFVLASAALMALSLPALALQPSDFQGKPDFAAEEGAGAFVWKDGDGLHVRFSTKGKPRRLHGKVCTPGQAVDWHPVRADYGDKVRKGPEGHCVHYDFLTADGVDGFDLRAPGPVVKFDFHVGDNQLATEHIHVGASNKHPANSPFVLNRTDAGPGKKKGKAPGR